MPIIEKIRVLSDLFVKQKYDKSLYQQIKDVYKEVLYELSIDFNNYKDNCSGFLRSLDCEGYESLNYSFHVLFEQFIPFLERNDFKKEDTSMSLEPIDDEIPKILIATIQNINDNSIRIQLSGPDVDISNIPSDKLKAVLHLIIVVITIDGQQINWDKATVESNLLNLIIGRTIAKRIDQVEAYYLAIPILFDRLISSGHQQVARSIAEELVVASYQDNLPEFGYYLSFKCYGILKNIHAGLMYGNLCLSILSRKANINIGLAKQFYMATLKFFGNTHQTDTLDFLVKLSAKNLQLSDYQRRIMDYTYQISLAERHLINYPEILLKYLEKEKDAILKGGEGECSHWLILLYDIKRYYPNDNSSVIGLNYYIMEMEKIVPQEHIKIAIDVIDGDLEPLKEQLKCNLIKLTQTQTINDFVFDNGPALRVATRVIPKSDPEAFLLAMLLKSDYSLVFIEKRIEGVNQAYIEEGNIETFSNYYNDPFQQVRELPQLSQTEIIWMAKSEFEVYQLNYYNRAFNKELIDSWDPDTFKNWQNLSSGLLLFDTDLKTKSGEVRSYLPEEYNQQERLIQSALSFIKVYSDDESKYVYLVKDTELSELPHNLILDQNGDFLSLEKPVCNIMSAEWLTKASSYLPLKKNYSKGIWIPTDAGDFTINNLFSKIESTLVDNNFTIDQSPTPVKPLDFEVNIVTSHGDREIALFQSLFINHEQYIHSTGNIVKEGKVIILFVCHSGSMKKDYFRNQFNSLIKYYFKLGYSAVVAPFWALHIYIPPIWLPVFLENLDNGLDINTCVYKSNLAVRDIYPTPGAWACMHLYGNPLTQIEK